MDKWLASGTRKEFQPNVEDLASSSQNREQEIKCDQSSLGLNRKNRKYCEEYIKYGFSYVGDKNCPKPQCIVCGDILSNGCMKPSLLLRHLQTKHANYKNKDPSFFKRLEKNKNKYNLTSYLRSSNNDLENAIEASYLVSYRIAKCGKNHTIAENLVLPCIKDVVRCMLGEDQEKKINNIPLSNNTISRRIQDMSDDVEQTIISRIKNSIFFAIQVDESTDVTNYAILLVIARYLIDDKQEENLLLCHVLTERTRGEDIFNAINSYFNNNGIDWAKCCGLCTDGAKSMSGIYSGLRGHVMKVAPNISWSHCCIHRQSLASKNLPGYLKVVLEEAIKVVNFIKSRPLNSRCFQALCHEMESIHSTLIFHTEVRWLSRGKVLSRLFELRQEIQIFFENHPFKFASKLHDEKWLQALAYLADIFLQINKLNLTLQNNTTTIFSASDKIESMMKKIDFWKSCIENGQPEVFENLFSYLSENNLRITSQLNQQIVEHLSALKSEFRKYFPKPDRANYWISNPFEKEYFEMANLSIKEKELLIDLSSDSTLKSKFKKEELLNFWAALYNEFGLISQKAIKFLLPFTSTELVEKAFSSYVFIKNKYRNKLNAGSDLRLYLTSVEPDIKKLCATKQEQGSH